MILMSAKGEKSLTGVGDFATYLRVKYKKRIEQVIQKELSILLERLKELTPKDTGAAASNTDGEGNKRSIYPGHKAVKAGIPYPYGWQMSEVKRVNVNIAEFGIFNPTWALYLRFVNLFHKTESHFVERAWQEHLARRKDKGYGN